MIEYFLKKLIEWGYLGVFLGSMIEGETIVMSLSAASYEGKFSFFLLVLLAFLGTLIADQFCFYVGKYIGYDFLKKYTSFNKKVSKILLFIEKYDIPFILSFRFIYGIRILTPFVIGASNVVSIKKFTLLNAIAAFLWSVLICSLGWMIGAISSKFLDHNSLFISFGFNFIISFCIIFISHRFFKVK